MSHNAKRLVAAAVAAVSIAVVPTIQAITPAGGLPLACGSTSGGGGCAG